MTDVLVIGAGMIGLTSAILLAEDGMDVRIVAAATSVLAVEMLARAYHQLGRTDEAIGLIQTMLNRAGLGQDVLYRYGKRDSTIRQSGQLVASLGLAAALLPASFAWSVTAPMFRTGASMQVIARPI